MMGDEAIKLLPTSHSPSHTLSRSIELTTSETEYSGNAAEDLAHKWGRFNRLYRLLYVPYNQRADLMFVILSGFFFVNTTTVELISGKLFQVGPWTVSIGSVLWPFVFIITDLTNEFYGKKYVRRISIIMSFLLIYVFVVLTVTIRVPTSDISPVSDESYNSIFGQSNWIIIGSLVAFLVGQLIDITVYHVLRIKTRGKYLWLRATGSNIISQLVDTYIVSAIAFLLPGKLTVGEYLELATVSYIYKLIIVFLLTPFVYVTHHAMDWYLGKKLADELVARALGDDYSSVGGSSVGESVGGSTSSASRGETK